MRSALLAAAILLGVLLRCVNIRQGLWWDEIWSTVEYAAAPSWWYTVSRLGYYFNNHPLYSIACRISIALLGLSEVSLRLPALIMGIAALPALYALARPLTGTAPALLAALLLAFSAFHIDHSTEARGYTGMMLFGLLASLLYFRVLVSGALRTWVLFILCTFLGFYCHVYMVQVPLVQVICCAVLRAEQALKGDKRPMMHDGALKHLVLALAAAALMTLAAYAPMLKFFVANAAKVQMLRVDRLPFVAEMYEAVLPGFATVPGMLLYGTLTVCGLLYMRRRSPVLLIYTVLISNLPLLLYLQLNPMFIFKRYFLISLPFCLLTLACGMEWIVSACRMRPAVRIVFYCTVIAAIAVLQWPAIRQITTQSRQHYREAMAFVEDRVAAGDGSAVFAVGQASRHFNFYARIPVTVPETFDDFQARLRASSGAWCLVTAWLPELRPAHEPALLYTEDPEQQRIYDYVRANFQLAACFRGVFRTCVYRWPVEKRDADR